MAEFKVIISRFRSQIVDADGIMPDTENNTVELYKINDGFFSGVTTVAVFNLDKIVGVFEIPRILKEAKK